MRHIFNVAPDYLYLNFVYWGLIDNQGLSLKKIKVFIETRKITTSSISAQHIKQKANDALCL